MVAGEPTIYTPTGTLVYSINAYISDHKISSAFSSLPFIYLSTASLAIGTHIWTVTDRDNISKQTKLSLTACPRGSFNCDDGTCLDLANKCDSSADCPDNSDEKNCTILLFSSDYTKEQIPDKHTGYGNTTNSVSVSVTISDILNIDINSGNVGLNLALH